MSLRGFARYACAEAIGLRIDTKPQYEADEHRESSKSLNTPTR